MVENFKGCTIQSDKQVDKIIASDKHVDVRTWLRNDSAKKVVAISDSERLVVDGSDPKLIQGYLLTLPTEFQLPTPPTEFQHKNYRSTQPSKLPLEKLPHSSQQVWWAREKV